MRTRSIISFGLLSGVLSAQVRSDKPIVLDAAAVEERTITGTTTALDGSDLITLGDARNGTYHLAGTGGTAQAIALTLTPACVAYAPGLSIRFAATALAAGPVTVNVDGLGPKRLLRSDRQNPAFGDILPGGMVEATYVDTAFILTQRAFEACPTNFRRVNDRLCIQYNDTLNVSIFTASDWCMQRGARLCSWDEYIQACTALDDVLEGFYDDWEWIDDTNDHTHTAVQAGRWNCRVNRGTPAIEASSSFGRVRCCYHTR
jgi:hypothetical protein